MAVPILIVAFRRPKHLKLVIDALQEVSNPIYFWIDGPRQNSDDLILIQSCLDIIHDSKLNITKVVRHDSNQGTISVANGVSWILKKHSSVIVIEEDVVPTPEFVSFAEEMLELYSDDFRIGNIAGFNLVPDSHLSHANESYRFSGYFYAWGWATWQNRWVNLDKNFNDWNYQELSWPKTAKNRISRRRWVFMFDAVKTGKAPGLWDYIWLYSSWKMGWMTVVPNRSLVTNIGFDEEATHTKIKPNWNLPEMSLIIQSHLVHPKYVEQDTKADKWSASNVHNSSILIVGKTFLKKWYESIRLSMFGGKYFMSNHLDNNAK